MRPRETQRAHDFMATSLLVHLLVTALEVWEQDDKDLLEESFPCYRPEPYPNKEEIALANAISYQRSVPVVLKPETRTGPTRSQLLKQLNKVN